MTVIHQYFKRKLILIVLERRLKLWAFNIKNKTKITDNIKAITTTLYYSPPSTKEQTFMKVRDQF